jgi:hypothetical protein
MKEPDAAEELLKVVNIMFLKQLYMTVHVNFPKWIFPEDCKSFLHFMNWSERKLFVSGLQFLTIVFWLYLVKSSKGFVQFLIFFCACVSGILNSWPDHSVVCGSQASHILNLGTRYRWMSSFTLRLLNPRKKLPRNPLDMSLGGPQSRSRSAGEEKNSYWSFSRSLKVSDSGALTCVKLLFRTCPSCKL